MKQDNIRCENKVERKIRNKADRQLEVCQLTMCKRLKKLYQAKLCIG